MDSGASQFASGKTEEDYSIRTAGQILDDLINNFSGSYKIPTGSQMPGSDYDRARKQLGGDSPSPAPSADPSAPSPSADPSDPSAASSAAPTPSPTPSIPQVGSWDDLMRVCHTALADTETYLTFDVVNGFTFDASTDVQTIYRELQREDPIYVSGLGSWSWGNSGNNYILEFHYDFPVDELIAMKEATPGLVDAAVNSIDAAGLSDYEIVLAVNNYLCDAAYYPAEEPYAPVTHTAYGAFHEGVSVCEGYACAAKLMLNEFGILCDIEIGVCTNGGGHAWNLVQLDGQWYQLDVTWNDCVSSLDYFLVTDDYMLQSRTWDFANYPASASEPYKP